MLSAPLPLNEEERHADLLSYHILDTDEEADFNHLVELASLICRCDMSVINFIDLTRQWGKAKYGLDDSSAPRKISMCAHAILQDDVMLVEDTLLDERFHDNPFTKDGGIRFYAGSPIRTEAGHNIGTICVCDTEPKKLDEKQKEALKHLSRQAAILLELRKRNAELKQFGDTERDLRKKAEAARKAQEQFLSTMSHEIRTPLNGVVGMANILHSEDPKPEQKEYIETLQFASRNLLCIVNDILDYSKISSGCLDLEEQPFHLHCLLKEIKKSHQPKAAEKGLTLTLAIAPETPQVIKADATRLTQILNNLVGNAVKFTLEGSVTIDVRPVRQNGNCVDICFAVKDTGIGFNEKEAAVLFKQFSQANSGITRKFGGTGLGLAITQKLVNLMGSAVEVTSKTGAGSVFSFTLSLPKDDTPVIDRPKEKEPEKSFEHLSVLLAEDNAINIMVTRKILQNRNVKVDVALNGQEAFDKITSSHYDLVLMDVQMPVMDGITTVKKLRAKNQYAGPVLLLTADAFINANHEVTDWGFDDYLLKPFTADELYKKINELTCKYAKNLAVT